MNKKEINFNIAIKLKADLYSDNNGSCINKFSVNQKVPDNSSDFWMPKIASPHQQSWHNLSNCLGGKM